ncbi:unnamed protein product [Gordionus sp. m RMFG-2023]
MAYDTRSTDTIVEDVPAPHSYSIANIPSLILFSLLLYSRTLGLHQLINNEYRARVDKRLDGLIQKLRVIKSANEQKLMRKACEIASHAFIHTMEFSYPQVPESVLETNFELECKKRMSSGSAYIPVVAGGNRACTIHYIDNNCMISAKDSLVLMDAGCEYQNYCSDISRTWPIIGKFTPAQKELYEALLEVQIRCIDLCKPSQLSLNELLVRMYQFMIKYFEEIKLLPAHLTYQEKFQMVSKLCPHHIGHHLGLDVHDCHLISRDEPLQPGMVITIEPGVYIPLHDTEFPKELSGYGMRIEDDILITQNGAPDILTNQCPKKCDIIESISCKNQK